MKKWKLLIIDDEISQREILRIIIENEGYSVKCAENGERALEIFNDFFPDIVLCDLKLPDAEGIDLMEKMDACNDHKYEFIIFTAHGTIESAVNAIKQGAFDYITKPVEREKLIITINRACKHLDLIRENIRLKKQLEHTFSVEGVIGRHPRMVRVINFIRKVSPLDVTVLITGETGTGKGIIARTIHSLSNRRNEVFQPVNCASMPDTLVDSELFGHEKGAFTGAFSRTQGLVENSDKGTLFFDEIGELPIGSQAKLLRFLEEKTIRRVGGKAEISVNTRVIAATNKKLDDEIRKGNFREDLFYRFRGFVIELPPLRERASDIYVLAKSFIEKYNLIFNRSIRDLSKESVRLLLGYEWPGNVRQLDSVIEKAVLLAQGDIITPDDLEISTQPKSMEGNSSRIESPSNSVSLDDMEREVILKAMEKSNGCMAKAADLLGTTYRTVEYRVKKYNIPRKNQRKSEDIQLLR